MKSFVCLLFCLFSCSFVFAAWPDGFSIDESNTSKIEGWKNLKGANYSPWDKTILDTILASSKLNVDELTYDEYKNEMIKAITVSVNENFKSNKSEFIKSFVAISIVCIKKNNKFILDLFKDSELIDSPYISSDVFCHPNAKNYIGKDLSIFRSLFVKTIKYHAIKKNQRAIYFINNALNIYQEKLLEIESHNALADLKKAKILCYQNIGINEDWKQISVRIEIMIKSFE